MGIGLAEDSTQQKGILICTSIKLGNMFFQIVAKVVRIGYLKRTVSQIFAYDRFFS